MPARMPYRLHGSTLRLKVLFQRLGQRHRADRIALTRRDQHPARGFGRGNLRLERDERMHQHCGIEKPGLFDQHIGENICAIGKAETDDRTGLILLPVGLDEIRKLPGGPSKICLLYTSPSPRDS